MFFKRLSDVYDEEYEDALQVYGDEESAKFAENHMFQIPEGSHWKDVRKNAINVGQALKKAMMNIEKANPKKLSGIFGDTNWSNKDRLSDRVLNDLIEHFFREQNFEKIDFISNLPFFKTWKPMVRNRIMINIERKAFFMKFLLFIFENQISRFLIQKFKLLNLEKG